ncbi:MAG: hypothetical protein KAS95_02000 [Candidatus Heimdallarchaeota archaeon]|nr:hypothetical protein [Candidatus Heimdallarchaeota archaeon]
MKKIKQLVFDITQSRRIKNYAERLKIEPTSILPQIQSVMEIIYQAWFKNYGQTREISFNDYFISMMKYAEYSHRLTQRHEEMKKVATHVEILRLAILEYDIDYNDIITIENIAKSHQEGSE